MQDSLLRDDAGKEGDDSLRPPIYYLSAHAYLCEFEDGAIILDVKSGSYLGIDAEHLQDLRARISNWPDSGRGERATERTKGVKSDSIFDDLLLRGILTDHISLRRSMRVQKCSSALTVTENRQALRKVSLRQTVQFLVAFLVATRHHKRGLAHLLEWLHQRQYIIHRDRRAAAAMENNAAERLASFMKLRIWCYTASRRCLFDSLALSIYMTRAAVPCTLVVGVITKPFRAHAWVQIGDLVLNDTAEHVQQFSPILAIGECEY